MQPFYFGSSREPLFGVYHAPAPAGRRTASVLCHPLGHEYLRAHRAFRNLAAALAERGCHVLRFDYLGSGDSSGDGERTTVSQCLKDVGLAIDELKDMSGLQKVTLVGLRVGAAFAALAAAGRRDVERVVLWDPVVDGAEYVAAVRHLPTAWLDDSLGASVTATVGDDELMGFPMDERGRRELMALTLAPAPQLRARAADLFVSEDRPDYRALQTSLETLVPVGYHVVPGAGEWDRGDLAHQILLPHAMVHAIAAEIGA
jgi:pimeloyl-ACP methyl ester carboxylesterase